MKGLCPVGDKARFSADLYHGTAEFYDRYRPPYPRAMLGDLVTRAEQYMISAHDEPFLSQGGFFEAELRHERPELKIEDSHALVWLDPNEALLRLRHDSHAWAVSAWLRARIPLR